MQAIVLRDDLLCSDLGQSPRQVANSDPETDEPCPLGGGGGGGSNRHLSVIYMQQTQHRPYLFI